MMHGWLVDYIYIYIRRRERERRRGRGGGWAEVRWGEGRKGEESRGEEIDRDCGERNVDEQYTYGNHDNNVSHSFSNFWRLECI